uniref:Binding-protein-dependent transport systems inner membrane component n=1 Tax=uncultured bacterium Contig99 TaxID=1393639 RepID=W0FNR9_9BACT|nr:binding-protein-dependent transport systems inner membrane component [uncultured bacterium Contig99]
MMNTVTSNKSLVHKKSIWLSIWQAKYIYLMLLPLFIWLGVFCYAPMYGILMAFKNFKARLGILGSEWCGMAHFVRIFQTPDAVRAIRNTVLISFGRLIFEFPMGIILALMLTEMPGKHVKKTYQTIYTFPHFLSWIIVAGIINNFLSSNGAVNIWLKNMGLPTINFLANAGTFRGVLYATADWKEMGWAAIIFMAAIAGIDPSLYEAATVDGASRLQQIWHVTLPGILTTICVMLILQVGNMMNAGFDQVFNMYNDVVKQVSNILDTYIYNITFLATPNYGFSTAVGLFKSVINFIMLIVANGVVYRLSGQKMFQ